MPGLHSIHVVLRAGPDGQPIEHRMVIQPEGAPPPAGRMIGPTDPTPRFPLAPHESICWPILRRAPLSACEAVARGRQRVHAARAAGRDPPAPPHAKQAATLLAMALAETPRRHMRSLCHAWGLGGGSGDLDAALWFAIAEHPVERLEAAGEQS